MLLTFLGACSSTSNQGDKNIASLIEPGTNAMTPISEQRLAASEFKKDGIKVYYTLFGNIDAIEVTGYAAVWGNSMNAARESYRVAELEAKKSLNDFINKETISSSTSVKMISENLEHAQDQNTNKFSSNKTGDTLLATDTDLVTKGGQENMAIRNNALKIASTLQTTITAQNKGILGGLYLKESAVVDDGKAVRVVMRWDKKNNAARPEIRKLMSQ
jgi:hypothetical protein